MLIFQGLQEVMEAVVNWIFDRDQSVDPRIADNDLGETTSITSGSAEEQRGHYCHTFVKHI